MTFFILYVLRHGLRPGSLDRTEPISASAGRIFIDSSGNIPIHSFPPSASSSLHVARSPLPQLAPPSNLPLALASALSSSPLPWPDPPHFRATPISIDLRPQSSASSDCPNLSAHPHSDLSLRLTHACFNSLLMAWSNLSSGLRVCKQHGESIPARNLYTS